MAKNDSTGDDIAQLALNGGADAAANWAVEQLKRSGALNRLRGVPVPAVVGALYAANLLRERIMQATGLPEMINDVSRDIMIRGTNALAKELGADLSDEEKATVAKAAGSAKATHAALEAVTFVIVSEQGDDDKWTMGDHLHSSLCPTLPPERAENRDRKTGKLNAPGLRHMKYTLVEVAALGTIPDCDVCKGIINLHRAEVEKAKVAVEKAKEVKTMASNTFRSADDLLATEIGKRVIAGVRRVFIDPVEYQDRMTRIMNGLESEAELEILRAAVEDPTVLKASVDAAIAVVEAHRTNRPKAVNVVGLVEEAGKAIKDAAIWAKNQTPTAAAAIKAGAQQMRTDAVAAAGAAKQAVDLTTPLADVRAKSRRGSNFLRGLMGQPPR